jgi:hypothetical protein
MTFHIGFPQAIYLSLDLMCVFMYILKNGQPRSEYSAVDGILGFIISIIILVWGGFFK